MVLYQRKAISLLLLSIESQGRRPWLSRFYHRNRQAELPAIPGTDGSDVIIPSSSEFGEHARRAASQPGAKVRPTMANIRLRHRASQFWHALLAPKEGVETRAIQPYLSPTQIVLFRWMHPSEQSHAFQVLNRLKEAGHDDTNLLTAALLHDIGKILSPLSIWERVEIVLGKHFFPQAVKHWSAGQAHGLHPFVVAEHHPAWWASLAAQTGASAQAVSLISRHHEVLAEPPASPADRLLAALQHADDS